MKLKTMLRQNFERILLIIFAFLVLIVVSYFFISGIVTRQMDQNGVELLNTAEATIKTSLTQSEISLNNIAFMLESTELYGLDQDALISYIKEWNSLLEGSETKGTFSALYAYIDGKVIFGADWLPPDTIIPTERLWYIGASENPGEVYFTEPYIDAYTGNIVITLSRVVSEAENGEYNVVGVDVFLSDMTDFVSGLGLSGDGYGILLSNDMTILAHNNPIVVGLNFGNTGYGALADRLANEGELTAYRFTDRDGADSIGFFRRIFNGWYVGVTISRTVYYSGVYQMTFTLGLLSLILIVVISYLLIRLTRDKLISEEESRSKTSFLAKMSHEIRTPMNAISGMTELILREDISPSVYEHTVGIKHASANLLSIINDILDYSKIESGSLDITPVRYMFSSLINDVINIIRVKLTDTQVLFVVNVDSLIPNDLYGDEVRIRQILINLLSNAVQYTDSGFISISVGGRMEGGNSFLLNIKVSDSGIGIREEDFGKLFHEFSQIDDEYKKSIEGTGLGLPITKSLLEAMGGDISVSSVYGRGSTFTVELPQHFDVYNCFATVNNSENTRVIVYETRQVYSESIVRTIANLGVTCVTVSDQSMFFEELRKDNSYGYAFVSSYLYESVKRTITKLNLEDIIIVLVSEYGEPVATKEAVSLMMPAHAVSIASILNEDKEKYNFRKGKDNIVLFIAPRARVLIVDDIITNLMVAEGLMSPYHMYIDTCTSGAEALELVKENKYDIVFMDHMMPGMDGIETTRRIRELEDGSGYFASLPVIALTANAVAGVRDMFLENGLNDFLSKPIDTIKLNTLLEKWLDDSLRERYVDDTVINDTPVFEIEGVDVKRGISMTGGNNEKYIKTLSVFYRDCSEMKDKIRKALSDGDILLFTTYVHAIKSAAGSIGATNLSEHAKLLEFSGKSGDTEFIAGDIDLFLSELETLTGNIRSVIPARESPGDVSGDLGFLKNELGRLATALNGMEAGAADAILSILQENYWPDNINNRLEEISQDILLFEYEHALEVIKGIVDNL